MKNRQIYIIVFLGIVSAFFTYNSYHLIKENAALKKELDACILFDTRRSPIANLTGKELAHWMGANYIYFPKINSGQVVDMVQREVEGLR